MLGSWVYTGNIPIDMPPPLPYLLVISYGEKHRPHPDTPSFAVVRCACPRVYIADIQRCNDAGMESGLGGSQADKRKVPALGMGESAVCFTFVPVGVTMLTLVAKFTVHR